MKNEALSYARTFLKDRSGSDFRQECLSLVEAFDDSEGYNYEELSLAVKVLTRLGKM